MSIRALAFSLRVEKVPAAQGGQEEGPKGGNGETLTQIVHQPLHCRALNNFTFPSLSLFICKMGIRPATLAEL